MVNCPRPKIGNLLAVAAAWAALACVPPPDEGATPERQQQPVISGTVTNARPEAFKLGTPTHKNCRTGVVSPGWCSATLVSGRFAVTAAHCMGNQAYVVGDSTGATIIDTSGAPLAGSPFPVTRMWGFDSSPPCSGDPKPMDVALVELTNAVPDVMPAMIATAQPAAGTRATLMGFGCTDRDSGAGGGIKRFFSYNWPTSDNACPGDSGGPVFLGELGQTGPIIATTSSSVDGFLFFDGKDRPADTTRHKQRIEQMIRDADGGFELGINRPGLDLPSFTTVPGGAAGVLACREACAKDHRCMAYSYRASTSTCFPKFGIPERVPTPGITSGLHDPIGNFDRPGNDLGAPGAAPSAKACMIRCANTTNCSSWTWVSGSNACYLKSGFPAAVSGCTSCYSGDRRFAEYDVDRPGPVFMTLTNKTPETCASACIQQEDCRSWTVENTTCKLRKVASAAVELPHLSFTESGVRGGLEYNVDRPGSDIKSVNLAGKFPEACQTACANTAGCVAWTMTFPGVCWLKSAVPEAVPGQGMVSGALGAEAF